MGVNIGLTLLHMLICGPTGNYEEGGNSHWATGVFERCVASDKVRRMESPSLNPVGEEESQTPPHTYMRCRHTLLVMPCDVLNCLRTLSARPAQEWYFSLKAQAGGHLPNISQVRLCAPQQSEEP